MDDKRSTGYILLYIPYLQICMAMQRMDESVANERLDQWSQLEEERTRSNCEQAKAGLLAYSTPTASTAFSSAWPAFWWSCRKVQPHVVCLDFDDEQGRFFPTTGIQTMNATDPTREEQEQKPLDKEEHKLTLMILGDWIDRSSRHCERHFSHTNQRTLFAYFTTCVVDVVEISKHNNNNSVWGKFLQQ
ncbi:hypothetical protein T10_4369 [Trichinella papuae]|uniref:Uncharacterized protein n=1 Tax=Trichinella papuae TaxID=268474 RepID=A0A0V1MK75_9BILA|nr:hypothetical protein T10_4369 [Trichinella papuae]